MISSLVASWHVRFARSAFKLRLAEQLGILALTTVRSCKAINLLR